MKNPFVVNCRNFSESNMLRPFLGNIGHGFVVLSFVFSLIATYFFFLDSKKENNFFTWAKRAFWIQSIATVGICVSLFLIIFNHYFEYHYAWDNASLSLPLGYAISCFWQDQEGSFLLWMFWNAIVGVFLLFTFSKGKKKAFADNLHSPTMVVISAIQAFLASMILGVVFFSELKIGSSPFLLLRQSMPDLQLWATNPDFIPKDGNGLNPLLQNYWMVIHPPTLFLGFSLTMVPFAMAIASLWKKDYKSWLKLALPWSLVAAVVLGTGIIMGGVWAYETLNFGGYWNWDPVENAVYVPWIILVAAFHTLFLAQKSSTALKYSYILIIAQFILILYSTFLTRSGILGNASVHSFTDLGLSGQLLIYLLTFVVLAIVLIAIRWKDLPRDQKELDTHTPDFWVFMGVLTLSLAAFQVILTTSIPVYNAIAEGLGFDLNWAMPTDPIAHFTSFQMWLFIVAIALTGLGQYFWWRRITSKKLNELIAPLIITLLVSSIAIILTKINDWKYIILLTASIFGLVCNLSILTDLFKGKFKVAGGVIAHVGVGLMLLGIMFSSAYERTISINMTGNQIFSDSEKESRENVLLWLNRPLKMGDFTLDYRGEFVDVRGVPGYIEKKYVKPIIGSGFKGLALAPITDNNDTLVNRFDTLAYEAENTYYQVAYSDSKGNEFNLYPRFQVNESMGNVASPDIKQFWNRDIYSHVTYVTREQDKEWSAPMDYNVALRDTFFLNDYVAILDDVVGVNEIDGMELKEGDAAAVAILRLLERDGEKIMKPTFVIKEGQVWSKPVVSNELGVKAQLSRIDPVSGLFTFSISRSEREYIVLKVIEKPLINLLWLGIILLIIGITVSAVRRFQIAFK
ncbi:cytochrome c-type biogenesis protein CcmF [Spirosomataceae bacterium TFI 002]|nr:cytochrome c-type biogenesis protein CcmF [Spirosomataceae bacterium TFI 002]